MRGKEEMEDVDDVREEARWQGEEGEGRGGERESGRGERGNGVDAG